MQSFMKMNSRNGEIILSFTDADKSCHSHNFLTSQICLANMSFKAICQNKILTKFLNLQFVYKPSTDNQQG